MPNWMPNLWLAEVSEWYEFSKERAVPEDGSLNPSNCSLRHLNTEDRDGVISLKDQGKKNEQRLQNKRTKHGLCNIPEEAVDTQMILGLLEASPGRLQ